MDIAGKHIVVTRPAHQAAGLVELIRKQGAHAIEFPVIDILPAQASAGLVDLMTHLDRYDIAIFISSNAVNYTVDFAMKHLGADNSFPRSIKIAAVGAATARTLQQSIRKPDIFPAGKFNSEALLDLDELKHVKDKKIVIFRGNGGRELLADSLKQRGATVSYAEVYKRAKPGIENNTLVTCLKNKQADAIIVTSDLGLQHLWEMVGVEHQQLLKNVQLVVMSDRSAQLAQQLGFNKQAVVAKRASDGDLIEALQKC